MDVNKPELRKRKKRRRLLWGGVGLVVVAVLVTAGMALGPALPRADHASLWIGTVKRGDMLNEVRATGTLVPRHKRWLAAATAARVDQVLVLPGARVEPDTVLIRLSNPEVTDALHNAQAQVAAAKANVAATRARLHTQLLTERSTLAKAKSDYASAKVKADADAKAIQHGVVPRVQYEQEKIALRQFKERIAVEQKRVASFTDSMRAQVGAAKASLAQKRSNQKLRQRQVQALTVKAGIAGVLQKVPVQEGEQIAEGTKLARIAQPGDLIARLEVPEVQAKDVALGMPVTVDTHNGKVKGKVERIDPSVTNGSVQVDVQLTGKLPQGARPDLSVDGRIRIAQLKNVLSVGRPALAKADSEISLFRLNGDGTATRVPVKIGAVSVDRVQVLKGLKPGARVILSDTSRWDDYDKIKVD